MSLTEGRVLNNQGEKMDAPTFDAQRLVRPTLLSIALYLSIIVISSMTMVKPAQASGYVNPQSTYCVVFYYIGGYVAHACSSSYSAACSTLDGASFSSAACGNLCVIDSSCRTPAYVGYDQNSSSTSSCPANSTGTTSCTCND